jgi:DNA-binding CsgD family transcriptional regulator
MHPEERLTRHMDVPTNRIFVGRQSEMNLLRGALTKVIAGSGRYVMLAGETGIGKTRSCQEIAAYAESRGSLVLHGRCVEHSGSAPYWPWVQVLRAAVRANTAALLRAAIPPEAALLAELVPEVRDGLPDFYEPFSPNNPEQGRLRLFDAVTRFLQWISQYQPLVIVFDNLHWADRSSLLLLEFMAEDLAASRLLLIGTYRDTELSRGHPLSQTLGELIKLPHFQRLSLAGLTEADVAQFIALVCGVSPPRALVREIHSRTAGNPLFVTEVVRLLHQQGVLSPGSITTPLEQDIGIPAGVRDAIRRRLDRLSQDCYRVLALAAVVGRQFGLDVLERLVVDLSSEQLLDTLEEALAAGIVEEVPGTFGTYQFIHVLIQETLASTLSSARRARLHGHIAEVLEAVWRDDLPTHAAELAVHFAQAEPAHSREKLATYALLAGERALAAFAHEEALLHFERGITAKVGQPMDAEVAALLFGLGRAQGATDQVQQAWENLGRAFDYYVETGDVVQAVHVAAYPLFFVPGVTRATRMTSRALQLVPSESLAAGRLLSRYGLLHNLESADYQRAHEALTQALAIARSVGDVALEMHTLANIADVHWYHLHWPEVVAYSMQAIDLAHRVGESLDLWPFYLAATGLWIMGHPEEASHYAVEMLQRAERLRNRGFLANAWLQNAIVPHLRGDWQAARDMYDRGLEVAPTWFLLLGFRAQLEYDVGNFSAGQVYLNKLFAVTRNAPAGPTGEHFYTALLPPLIARITGVASRFEVTEEAASIMRASPSLTPLMALDVWYGLALLAVYRGDVPLAQAQYATLKPMAGALLQELMAADRVLGLLAHTCGDFAAAATHFEQALAFCRTAGYLPELAWTCHDYAETLLDPRGSNDRVRAVALLAEGMALARQLGMAPVLERLASLQDKCKIKEATPTYPVGLTEREVAVLCRLAAGKSNKAIAAELFISPHTVNYHLKNIFFKTAAVNRAEAAAFAVRHGLV